MALINCSKCGKMFNSQNENEKLCIDCGAEEQKGLKKILDYLRKSPLASVMDVHRDTGIPHQEILKFVRNGTLKMRGGAEALKCRICGRDITKGIACDKCKSRIEKGFNK